MSWMMPPPSAECGTAGVAGWLAGVRSADTGTSRRRSGPGGRAGRGHRFDGGVLAEELLDPVPALFHPAQRQAQRRDTVPHRVIDLVRCQPDEHATLIRRRPEA